jgi:hypothetical protein
MIMEASVGPQPWGPDWMPITLKGPHKGVLFACRNSGYTQEVLEKVLYRNAEAYFPAAAASRENASDAETASEQLRVG